MLNPWVWAIVVGGDFGPMTCQASCADATTEMIILDYPTGAYVEAMVPGLP